MVGSSRLPQLAPPLPGCASRPGPQGPGLRTGSARQQQSRLTTRRYGPQGIGSSASAGPSPRRLSSAGGDAGQRPGGKGDPGEAGGDGGSQRPGQGGGVEKDGGDCCGVKGEEDGAGGGGEPGPVVAALAGRGERKCHDRQQQDSAEAQPGRAWQWPGPGTAEG